TRGGVGVLERGVKGEGEGGGGNRANVVGGLRGEAASGPRARRAPAAAGGGLNAQREQCDRADSHDQDDQSHRVVIEPMPALYTHDVPRPESRIHSCPVHEGRVVACVSISRGWWVGGSKCCVRTRKNACSCRLSSNAIEPASIE